MPVKTFAFDVKKCWGENQRSDTSIEHSQYNTLECPEKRRKPLMNTEVRANSKLKKLKYKPEKAV